MRNLAPVIRMGDGRKVVIVGAGHAGGTAAALLRQYGFTGEVILLGDEGISPYQRPPLSKAYLLGKENADDLKLWPDTFYSQKKITLRLDVSVQAIDRPRKRVCLASGEEIEYDVLILATGSRARPLDLPGASVQHTYQLRSLADAEALRAAVQPGSRIALIGGGYIGLEVAASATMLGASAVVIEREQRLLARVASRELSDFLEKFHRSKGVEIITGAQVSALARAQGGANSRVMLDDGRSIACDAVVVCVGGVPCDDLARVAGIVCDRGVVVDADARTSDECIFAIGDMTRRPSPFDTDRLVQLESVPSAIEQAKQAASAIVKRPRPKSDVPWFWSHQFNIKLQIAGFPFGADSVVVRGDTATNEFALFHFSGDRVRAVEAVNAPADFTAGKLMIGGKMRVSRALLKDPAYPLSDLLAGAA